MQKTLRFARVMDTSRLDNDTVGLLRRVEITNLAFSIFILYLVIIKNYNINFIKPKN